MRFKVECYENPNAFQQSWYTDENAEAIYNHPLRHAATLNVEVDSAEDAAHEVFHIGNAPWNPPDANGTEWPHLYARSMSTGDVVVVETPDGNVAYLCMGAGFQRVRGDLLQLAVDTLR